MAPKEYDVWAMHARLARMDAEIGALWDMVLRHLGEPPRVPDPRQTRIDFSTPGTAQEPLPSSSPAPSELDRRAQEHLQSRKG